MTKKSSNAASPKAKGEAAVASEEVSDEPRSIEWEGVSLSLRPVEEIPSTFKFDLIEFQDAPSDVNFLRLIKNTLEPEGYALVRHKFSTFGADRETEEKAMEALFGAALGLEPGESQASD